MIFARRHSFYRKSIAKISDSLDKPFLPGFDEEVAIATLLSSVSSSVFNFFCGQNSKEGVLLFLPRASTKLSQNANEHLGSSA